MTFPRLQVFDIFLFFHLMLFANFYSYLDGLSLRDLCEDAVKAAVVADGQIAEVMVGVANDGHGSIWKKRCSRLSSSDQVMKTECTLLNLSVSGRNNPLRITASNGLS